MKWDSIETFFLDMDGTLLDLAYDNYFWHQHIPSVYAKYNNITFKKAKLILEKEYKKKQGSIQWYCLEYWSKKTNINLSIELLKTKNKIKVFPGAIDFLQSLKKKNIKIILLTNCPREMLNVKITQCKLWGYFNKIISSEDYEFAKETDQFWKILEERIFFNKNKTVFIDDNQDVLRYSYRNGIKNLVSINFPDSNEEKKSISKFLSIDSISLFNPEIIK